MIYTQKQLEGMSDFELNKLTAGAEYGNVNCTNSPSESDSDCWVTLVDGNNLLNTNYNPCNNPSDIIPLCFEEGISLIAPEGHSELWMAIPRGRGDINVAHKNPLRAATIAYILVMQSK